MAGRQAKVLTPAQVKAVLAHLTTTRYPERDKAMFLLSLRAGLRATEIAGATWSMVLAADGLLKTELVLEDRISKHGSGGTIPLSKDLRDGLAALHQLRAPVPSHNIIYSERGNRMSAGSVAVWFHNLYRRLGFEGCSSHSGRRTAITGWARKISLVGGSLRDVQRMARHASLTTTARYIDTDSAAMRRVVDLV